MQKAQIYMIALVFVFLTLLGALYTFQKVEFSNPFNDFKEIRVAAEMRNAWIAKTWYNLSWKNKLVVNVTGISLPNIEIEFSINNIDCSKELKAFYVGGGTFAEKDINVTSQMSPCNVTMHGSIGLYEIYYNNSGANENNPVVSEPNYNTEYFSYVESAPGEEICSFFEPILHKKGIAFKCLATPLGNKYVWNITYKAADFIFNGNLN